MLFTIAIPTYNNEKTIAKAIHSSLNQDYNEEYEVLIVNNASKDKTQSVIESFSDKKIRVVVNKETCDMYSNHNICLKEAKGDYILFCHSDDELFSNALSILSEKITERKFPSKYILWGHSIYKDFFHSIRKGGQPVNTVFCGEAAIRCFLCGGLTPSGTCYSRKALLDIGGFPTSNSKAPEMDWIILIIATFNFFEFEMLEHIYIKRKEASTAVDTMTRREWSENHEDAVDILFSILSKSQKEVFIREMLVYGTLDRLQALRKYITKMEYLKRVVMKKWAIFSGMRI